MMNIFQATGQIRDIKYINDIKSNSFNEKKSEMTESERVAFKVSVFEDIVKLDKAMYSFSFILAILLILSSGNMIFGNSLLVTNNLTLDLFLLSGLSFANFAIEAYKRKQEQVYIDTFNYKTSSNSFFSLLAACYVIFMGYIALKLYENMELEISLGFAFTTGVLITVFINTYINKKRQAISDRITRLENISVASSDNKANINNGTDCVKPYNSKESNSNVSSFEEYRQMRVVKRRGR